MPTRRRREVTALAVPAPNRTDDGMSWLNEQGAPPVLDERGRLAEPFSIAFFDHEGELLKRERYGVGIRLPATPAELSVLQMVMAPLDHKGVEQPATEAHMLFGQPVVGRPAVPYYPQATGGHSHGSAEGGPSMAKAKVKSGGKKAATMTDAEKDEQARKARVRNRAWKRARAVSTAAMERFVRDWAAGKVDWKALEKAFATEDKSKGEKKPTVKATAPKAAAKKKGTTTTKPSDPTHPGLSKGAIKGPRFGTSHPVPKPTAAKSKGNRQAIQKTMAAKNGNGSNGKERMQETADANLKAAEETGNPEAVASKK